MYADKNAELIDVQNERQLNRNSHRKSPNISSFNPQYNEHNKNQQENTMWYSLLDDSPRGNSRSKSREIKTNGKNANYSNNRPQNNHPNNVPQNNHPNNLPQNNYQYPQNNTNSKYNRPSNSKQHNLNYPHNYDFSQQSAPKNDYNNAVSHQKLNNRPKLESHQIQTPSKYSKDLYMMKDADMKRNYEPEKEVHRPEFNNYSKMNLKPQKFTQQRNGFDKNYSHQNLRPANIYNGRNNYDINTHERDIVVLVPYPK